jgi:uncharacterized phage-associated protein
MANVFDVAAYLLSKADIEEGDGMTHLKLQKLLYYCQGFSLVLLKEPLFENVIEAWAHGPVVPDVYYEFKRYGNGIIDSIGPGSASALSDNKRELIDEVYDVYGGYSASKLRNLTHNERPWIEAENRIDTTITQNTLRGFFPSLVDSAYAQTQEA